LGVAARILITVIWEGEKMAAIAVVDADHQQPPP